METIWLEDFLAILDEGGFSRAAERRAITQPAFSRRIRSLEDWLGTNLFDRGTHSIRLTPAGERFRPVAEEVLQRLQIGRHDAVSAAQNNAETLRFASTHALSLTFFPEWLRMLEGASPVGATIQLTADNMVACERLMIEGHAQFPICHHHPAATNRLEAARFRSIPLGRERLLPVVSPSLLSANGMVPYLAFAPESGMGRILAAAWASHGGGPQQVPVFTSHLASALVVMAREGRGMAWVPLSLAKEDLEAGRLVRAGEEAGEISIEIRLFRPKARQSAVAEAFWDCAAACS